jgi:integral membrane protein
MFSFLNIFRITALLEGVSYILLLFIATPVKYLLNDPQYVKLLGMPHGLLFIGYVILAFMLKNELKWSQKQFMVVLLASIIPFGTFYIDKKYLKPLRDAEL